MSSAPPNQPTPQLWNNLTYRPCLLWGIQASQRQGRLAKQDYVAVQRLLEFVDEDRLIAMVHSQDQESSPALQLPAVKRSCKPRRQQSLSMLATLQHPGWPHAVQQVLPLFWMGEKTFWKMRISSEISRPCGYKQAQLWFVFSWWSTVS